jgi:hypothetical protein
MKQKKTMSFEANVTVGWRSFLRTRPHIADNFR